MLPELSTVHLQRLRRAVEVAREGGEVRFRVNPTDPRTVVWWQVGKPRTQHAICNAFGDPKPWLSAVQAKFEELTVDTMRSNEGPTMRSTGQ